jgi:DNA-binding NarL/FixJ family response regulator
VSEAAPPVRLLLVDDHPTSREPLAELLDRQPDLTVVGQAGSLVEARVLLAGGLAVDVALVDLGLPDGDGTELVREVCRRQGTVTVVFTGSPARLDHARAVEAGASCVIPKTAPTRRIVEAIRCLSAGEVLLSRDEAAELVALAARSRTRDERERAALARLTAREREVLALLAEGLGNEAIASRLGVGVETARTHVGRVLDKLGVASRIQAVLLAIRNGIAPPS